MQRKNVMESVPPRHPQRQLKYFAVTAETLSFATAANLRHRVANRQGSCSKPVRIDAVSS
jgi:hypothetical protein